MIVVPAGGAVAFVADQDGFFAAYALWGIVVFGKLPDPAQGILMYDEPIFKARRAHIYVKKLRFFEAFGYSPQSSKFLEGCVEKLEVHTDIIVTDSHTARSFGDQIYEIVRILLTVSDGAWSFKIM